MKLDEVQVEISSFILLRIVLLILLTNSKFGFMVFVDSKITPHLSNITKIS